MSENVSFEDLAQKDIKRGQRLNKSEAARQRRKEMKTIREVRLLNEWAKARRERKHAKSQ